jgi:O-antigen/teichoic acid export membrane protein
LSPGSPNDLGFVDPAEVPNRLDEIGPGSLRRRAARGTIVNSVWLVALAGLSVLRGVSAAALLGAEDYGVYGMLTIVFGTLGALGAVGFDDKYINQDHPDQEAAFEIAFTLQTLLGCVLALVGLATLPLFAMLYDEPDILLPGLVLAATFPLLALHTPIWVFYRRMDFMKQRILQSYELIVAFVVTIALAIAGLGVWALVIGSVLGSLTTAVAAVRSSPYRLRFRWERGALAEYSSFSWPLWVSSLTGVLTGQVLITVAARALGTAAVGAISLATTVSNYTRRVDDIVTQTLYPAICAVKDQTELLFESFSKSNRLALLWGFPAGIGLALFADEIIRHVFGSDWELAIPVIQVLGVTAAVDQIGFNWTAFARARGETRPLGFAAVVGSIVLVAVGVPLVLEEGLTGYAIAVAVATAAVLVVRMAYLLRLFPGFRVFRHISRAIVPTVPAALLILGERAVTGGGGGAGRAVAEALAYVALVIVGTVIAERELLREAIGYLRRERAPAT